MMCLKRIKIVHNLMQNLIIVIIGTVAFLPNHSMYSVTAFANCPTACQCDDDTLVVKCDKGTLGVLPIALNPSIQRLVINNNKIKTIDSSLQFYAELTYLDLSYNDLTNIPQRTFAYQRRLKTLELNHNKIGQINNKTFIGLNGLIELNLRGNMMAELGERIFTLMPKLEILNLGQNRISNIDEQAFMGLTKLHILYLDDNTLATMPATTIFDTIPHLTELYLGINSFLTLTNNAFGNLHALKRLDLRGAGLHNISNEAFKSLTNLTYLDLSDNRLQKIPSTALSNLQYLETLYMGENDFELIETAAFTGLKGLKHLNINNAQRLRRIESGALTPNTNLLQLNISSNRMLNEIHENAFRGLTHIRYVALQDNQLETFKENLLPWQDLDTCILNNNPIVCDCRLLWLRNLLLAKNNQHNNTADLLPINCAAPLNLREQAISSLTPQLLGCANNEFNKETMICIILIIIIATILALAFLLCGCRRRLRQLLKGSWGNSPLGHKGSEYQKTFGGADEEYMTRLQQQQSFAQKDQRFCSSLPVPYATPTSNMSDIGSQLYNVGRLPPHSIPVTEL